MALEEALKIMKIEIDSNPNLYVLSFDKLKEFLGKVQGSVEQLKIAKEFTTDITGLLLTLKDLYVFIEDRAVKNRFTRLINHIREQIKM